jgi:hypothetical protein
MLPIVGLLFARELLRHANGCVEQSLLNASFDSNETTREAGLPLGLRVNASHLFM